MNPQALNEVSKLRQKEIKHSVQTNQISQRRTKPGRGPSLIGEIFGKIISD